MKGLINIPSLKNLSGAYQKIQSRPEKILVDEWSLWSQWSRLDARLAELFVKALFQQWRNIPSIELNEKIRKQPWPSAMGVLLGHVEQELRKDEVQLFRAWSSTVMAEVALAYGEQFFIGTVSLGSSRMRRLSLAPTSLYVDWGYLGSEYLWNKKKPTRTISQKNNRNNILNQFIEQKKRFTVKDYIHELDQAVTLRQAQRDLKNNIRLKKIGNTKGTFYIPKI